MSGGRTRMRKIDLMHNMFGLSPTEKDICRNCRNLMGEPNTYFKCTVYGQSRSEATDWVKKWRGCGMFNKEYTGLPVKRMAGAEKDDIQCEGQLSFEDL